MNDFSLISMTKEDIAGVVDLIRTAMNPDEAEWASGAVHFHFACLENNLHDGRNYFVWKNRERVLGVTGLHHYDWGPKENVWLGWFALDPLLQGKGFGDRLFDSMISYAKEMGFKKMFIETYISPAFEKARRFYEKKGFRPVGRIENYLPDGDAMIVYLKVLET